MPVRRLFASWCAFLLAGVALAGPVAPEPEPWPEPMTVPLPAALETAVAEGKPLMLVFGADWCGWCRRLERETLPMPLVRRAAERFIAFRIDMESGEGEEAARKYGVQSLPTVLILDPSGRVIDTSVGFVPASRLAEFLDSSASAAVSVDDLLARASGPDSTPTACLEAGRALLLAGRGPEAVPLLERAAAESPTGSGTRCRAYLTLAAIASEGQDPGEAVRLSSLSLDTGDPDLLVEVYTARIALLRDLGRDDLLLETWRGFARALPGDVTVQEDLVRALGELGAPPGELLDAAVRVLALRPDSAIAEAGRARALSEMNRYEEALASANRAIALDPDDTASRVLRLRLMEAMREGGR